MQICLLHVCWPNNSFLQHFHSHMQASSKHRGGLVMLCTAVQSDHNLRGCLLKPKYLVSFTIIASFFVCYDLIVYFNRCIMTGFIQKSCIVVSRSPLETKKQSASVVERWKRESVSVSVTGSFCESLHATDDVTYCMFWCQYFTGLSPPAHPASFICYYYFITLKQMTGLSGVYLQIRWTQASVKPVIAKHICWQTGRWKEVCNRVKKSFASTLTPQAAC